MADALGFATKGGKSNPKAIASSRGTQYDINAIRRNAGVLGDVIGQGDDASYKQFVQQQQAKPQIQAKPQQQPATKSQPSPAQNLFNKFKKIGKEVASSATTGEQKFSQGIARTLPGGTADIQAEQKASEQAQKNMQLVKNNVKNPTQAKKIIQSNAAEAGTASKNATSILNKLPTKKQIALGAASTAADVLTAGSLPEIKALRGANVTSKVARGTVAAGAYGTAGALNTAAGGGNKKQIAENFVAGAVLPGALHVAGKGVVAGAKAGTQAVGKGMEALSPHTEKAINNIMNTVRAPRSLIEKVKANTEFAANKQKETAKAAIEVPKLEQKIELINAKKADGKFSNVDKVKVKQLEDQKKAYGAPTDHTSATATTPQAQLPSGVKPEQPPVPKESSVTSVDNNKNIVLPENHAKYFNVENATDTVPLSKLVSSKTPEENVKGGANAAKFMDQASKGEIDKRNPITVTPTADGNYKVLDGNGTLTAAQKAGWQDMPVNVVKPEHGEAAQALVDSANKVNPAFQENLKNFSKGMGYNYIAAPVKSLDRVLRKGTAEYQGDFSKLKDTVRGTIVAPEVNRMPAIVEHLKRTFDVVRVKNGYEGAKHGDYKDIKVNIRTPDGHIGEIIIATPRTIAIKEGRTHKLYEIMQDEKASKLEKGAAKHETHKLYRQSHLADLADSKASASAGDLPYSSSKTLAASEGETSRADTMRLSGTEAPVKTTEASKLSGDSVSRSKTSSSKKNLSLISSNTPTKSITHSNKSGNSLLDKTGIKASKEAPKSEAPTSKTPDENAKLVEEVAQEYPNKEQFIKDTAEQYHNMEAGLKGGQLVSDKEQYGHGLMRTSDHTSFYREFFKENKRAPKLADYEAAVKNEFEGKKGNLIQDSAEHDIYQLLKDREEGNTARAVLEGSEPITAAPERARSELQRTTDVATGKSKVAQRIANDLKQQYGDLAEYQKINLKDQAERAEKLLNDRELLDKVISGEEHLPAGLRATSVITAIRNDPELSKNPALLLKLEKSHLASEASYSAQELRIARENAKLNPIEAIKSIKDVRAKVAVAKTGKSIAQSEKADATAIKAATPKVTKETWSSFVESLKCR